MRANTSTWFDVTVKYDKRQDDGTMKKVSELYLVNAVTCSKAESRIIKELTAYIEGELNVVCIKLSTFKEVWFSDNEKDDKWFKVKLAFITINERTEEEKRTNASYLVQASGLEKAVKNTKEMMKDTASDYFSLEAKETKYVDVFE